MAIVWVDVPPRGKNVARETSLISHSKQGHVTTPPVASSRFDPVAHDRNEHALNAELKKTKPRDDVLRELTHIQRRAYIVEDNPPISDVFNKHPLLKKPAYIRQDFDCLMEGQTRFSEVVSGWRDKWVTAVDTYLSTHISKKSLGSKISDCNDELKSVYALEGLSVAMNPRSGGGIVYYKKGSSSLSEVLQSVHAQGCLLVDFTDQEDAELYLVVEKNILFRIPVKENSVGYLMAVHYVFNIHYNKAAAPALLFIQEIDYPWSRREG